MPKLQNKILFRNHIWETQNLCSPKSRRANRNHYATQNKSRNRRIGHQENSWDTGGRISPSENDLINNMINHQKPRLKYNRLISKSKILSRKPAERTDPNHDNKERQCHIDRAIYPKNKELQAYIAKLHYEIKPFQCKRFKKKKKKVPKTKTNQQQIFKKHKI